VPKKKSKVLETEKKKKKGIDFAVVRWKGVTVTEKRMCTTQLESGGLSLHGAAAMVWRRN